MMTFKFILFFFLSFQFYLQSGPKLSVIGGEAQNLGNFHRGREVVLEITFNNSGDEDLKITSVSTTCGCSSALLSGDVIKPGESGSIKFTYNGQGFGSVTKGVVVITNEAQNNTHNISITMNMVDPVTLNPASIISSGKVGENVVQSASITNNSGKDMIVNEIISNSPAVEINHSLSVLSPQQTGIINVIIKIYVDSPVNAAIIIKTSEGEFQIPILVDVQSGQ